MAHQESLLVIIEPTQESQIALDRAIITSQLRENKPRLHLFFSVDEENTDLQARNPKLYRNGDWLKAVIQRVEDAGLDYDYELCWSTEWYKAVLNYSDRVSPDTVYIPDYAPEVRRSLFTNSKWALLRKSLCPVMIIRPGASSHRKKILAAVNIQNENPKYVELNDKILKKGLAVAKLYNADFYVINAYSDSLNYPNREKILKMTGLPSKYVHVEEGQPSDVIPEYAKRIGADLVIIGTMARSGASAFMRGNTAEKVLLNLPQDVMTYS